jgi:Transposase DDE domain
MSRKLHTKAGKRDYARRKAIVEPVFGQIKGVQRAHQLRLRSKVKAEIEWTVHLACQNFRELAGSGWTTTLMVTN